MGQRARVGRELDALNHHPLLTAPLHPPARWADLPSPTNLGSLAPMLLVAEPYRRLFERLGLDSVGKVTAFFLPAAQSERVVVRQTRLTAPDHAPVEVFFKQYQFARPAWNFVGRRSKARCEFDNYAIFAHLQVPAAEAIATGEDRDRLGRLRSAFIVTRAVPASSTLVEFMQGPARLRATPAQRTFRGELITQLAAMTRRIHDARFFHHDLVWRNVLVSRPASRPVRLVWIDCPRGSFARWPGSTRRRRIKDLASLDKPAGRWCTRGERVRFVREYLGLTRLNTDAKQLIRDTLHYRRTRWPEDWDGR